VKTIDRNTKAESLLLQKQ